MRWISPPKLALIACAVMVAGTAILYAFSHIRIEFSFVSKVLLATGALQLLNIRYYRQKEWPLVAAIHGASLLAIYTTAYTVAHYAIPEHTNHFWDAEFAAFDAFFGLTADDIVPWVRSYPELDTFLRKIYYGFFFHFALFVPYAAGVRKNPLRMYRTLAAMFVTAIIGLILFAIFPAKNAVWFYGHEDIHHTLGIVEHLVILQQKQFELLTHENALGLIQFPSFHVAIAAILCWDLKNEHVWIFRAGWIWFFLMSLSAVTTGGHYVVDIWGGIFIAAAGILTVYMTDPAQRRHDFDKEST